MNIHPKVQAAGFAGAITTLVLFGLQTVNIIVPADVAAAFTTLVAFGAAFFTSAA
jgi:hypothetical protein